MNKRFLGLGNEGMRLERELEGAKIQERDLEIFRFLLEMKFSDLELMHEMFFKEGFKGSPNLAGVRTRIGRLEKAGFLKASFGERGSSKKYYYATHKAFRTCEMNWPDEILVRPIKALPTITFEHDKIVSLSRLKLEIQGRARSWKSERRIKAEALLRGVSLERDFTPDGIYLNKINEWVAFEYENSPKTFDRLEKKIEKYFSIMNDPQGLFKFAYFLTTSRNTENSLKELTKSYLGRFVIESYNQFLSI